MNNTPVPGRVLTLDRRVAPQAAVPGLIGPDNGMDDMSATHLGEILNVGAAVMTAASYHDYWNPCCLDGLDNAAGSLPNNTDNGNATVLNVSCIDGRVSTAEEKFLPVTRNASVPLWLTEGALHASSGVAGLTNTFTSSLFYAHALGQLARHGVGLFSRQTLLGGNYEIIDKITGLPNPGMCADRIVYRLLRLLGCTNNACTAIPFY